MCAPQAKTRVDLASLSSALHHAILAGDLELLASLVLDTMLVPMVVQKGASLQLLEPIARVCEAFPLERDGDVVRLSIHIYFSLALIAAGDRLRAERVLLAARARLGTLAGEIVDAQLGNVLGALYRDERRLDEAMAVTRPALAIARRHGNAREIVAGLRVLAMTHLFRRDLDPAFACATEGMAVATASGDRVGMLAMAIALGACELERDRAAARAHLSRGLVLARQLGDRRSEARCLQMLADVAEHVDVEALRDAIAIRVEIGDRANEAQARRRLSRVLREVTGDEGRAAARTELRDSIAAALEVDARSELADSLRDFAMLCDSDADAATCDQVADLVVAGTRLDGERRASISRITHVDAARWDR